MVNFLCGCVYKRRPIFEICKTKTNTDYQTMLYTKEQLTELCEGQKRAARLLNRNSRAANQASEAERQRLLNQTQVQEQEIAELKERNQALLDENSQAKERIKALEEQIKRPAPTNHDDNPAAPKKKPRQKKLTQIDMRSRLEAMLNKNMGKDIVLKLRNQNGLDVLPILHIGDWAILTISAVVEGMAKTGKTGQKKPVVPAWTLEGISNAGRLFSNCWERMNKDDIHQTMLGAAIYRHSGPRLNINHAAKALAQIVWGQSCSEDKSNFIEAGLAKLIRFMQAKDQQLYTRAYTKIQCPVGNWIGHCSGLGKDCDIDRGLDVTHARDVVQYLLGLRGQSAYADALREKVTGEFFVPKAMTLVEGKMEDWTEEDYVSASKYLELHVHEMCIPARNIFSFNERALHIAHYARTLQDSDPEFKICMRMMNELVSGGFNYFDSPRAQVDFHNIPDDTHRGSTFFSCEDGVSDHEVFMCSLLVRGMPAPVQQ